MIEFNDVASTEGWFQQPGIDYDIVIASRVRLSRNLNGYTFPHILQLEEEKEIRDKIAAAFDAIGFETSELNAIPKIERRMLLERNYVSRDFTMQTHKACVLSPDRSASGMINENDHLRLSVIQGGRSLSGCWELADDIDSQLESYLDFAVSLEWGYLNADVMNSGTGMRSSVMLHLPALVETGLIEKAMKAVVQVGMTVKGFFGEDEDSLGQMYQISNQLTFGFSENDLVEKLDAIAQQLVHYERKARNEYYDRARLDVEDRVLRALGNLKYCRKLSAKEAVEYLSAIRLGVSLGILNAPLERVTALLFLSQNAHVQHIVDSRSDAWDDQSLEAARAKMIREALINDDVNWEDLHV